MVDFHSQTEKQPSFLKFGQIKKVNVSPALLSRMNVNFFFNIDTMTTRKSGLTLKAGTSVAAKLTNILLKISQDFDEF